MILNSATNDLLILDDEDKVLYLINSHLGDKEKKFSELTDLTINHDHDIDYDNFKEAIEHVKAMSTEKRLMEIEAAKAKLAKKAAQKANNESKSSDPPQSQAQPALPPLPVQPAQPAADPVQPMVLPADPSPAVQVAQDQPNQPVPPAPPVQEQVAVAEPVAVNA